MINYLSMETTSVSRWGEGGGEGDTSKLVVHLLSWWEGTSAKITRFYIHLNDQLIANTQFSEIIHFFFALQQSLIGPGSLHTTNIKLDPKLKTITTWLLMFFCPSHSLLFFLYAHVGSYWNFFHSNLLLWFLWFWFNLYWCLYFFPSQITKCPLAH